MPFKAWGSGDALPCIAYSRIQPEGLLEIILVHVSSYFIEKWWYLSGHYGPVVPFNVLHAALAEVGVVRVLNKLRPNISEAVRYRDMVIVND